MAYLVLNERTKRWLEVEINSDKIEAVLDGVAVKVTIQFPREQSRTLASIELVLSLDETEALGTQMGALVRTARARQQAS